MKKAEIKIGGKYVAKVSNQLAVVKIICESPYGGWNAVNTSTGREIRIRGVQRLRREVTETK